MGFEVLDSVSDEILRGFIKHLGPGMPLQINAAGGSRRARKVLAHLAERESFKAMSEKRACGVAH
jgi:hypothetical protein